MEGLLRNYLLIFLIFHKVCSLDFLKFEIWHGVFRSTELETISASIPDASDFEIIFLQILATFASSAYFWLDFLVIY